MRVLKSSEYAKGQTYMLIDSVADFNRSAKEATKGLEREIPTSTTHSIQPLPKTDSTYRKLIVKSIEQFLRSTFQTINRVSKEMSELRTKSLQDVERQTLPDNFIDSLSETESLFEGAIESMLVHRRYLVSIGGVKKCGKIPFNLIEKMRMR